METNRQKKIGGVIQKIWLISYKVKWEKRSNLIISVSKVVVTSDLSVATVLSIFLRKKKSKGL
jgi:ribosome-binding factor A